MMDKVQNPSNSQVDNIWVKMITAFSESKFNPKNRAEEHETKM
jgi:hypothetical protein